MDCVFTPQPVLETEYEVWNDDTPVRRITRDATHGRWIMDRCWEEYSPVVPTRYFTLAEHVIPVRFHVAATDMPRGIGQPCYRYGFEHDKWVMETRDVSIPSSTLSFDMYFSPGSDIILHFRIFQKIPLRQGRLDPIKDVWKWSRVADVIVTTDQARQGLVSIPAFIASDMYMFQDPATIQQHPGLASFDGYQRLYARTSSSRLRIQPAPSSAEKWIKLVYDEMIIPEATVMMSLRDTPGVYSPCIREDEDWEVKVMAPLNFRLSGRLIPGPSDPLYMGGGVSAQSFWYVDGNPAVTEGWLIERLQEVMASRGRTMGEFVRTARELITRIRDDPGDDSALGEEWHECLVDTVNVIRMHCMSRHYMYDHGFIDAEWIGTDERTDALTRPGDCEDDAGACYQIHMTILFCKWNSDEAKALQSIAAMIGFPCGITGSAAEPFTDQSVPRGQTTREPGHMFAAILPFYTFMRAVSGGVTAEQIGVFRDRFGFPPPRFHTKPAILESIFFATPFYSDHRDISPGKLRAHETVHEWLQEKGEAYFDWEHYTMTHIMGKQHMGQGCALRLFTEAHLVLWKGAGGLTYRMAGRDATTTRTPCRSFVFYQPNDLSREFTTLFPGGGTARMQERVEHSQGYGLPIELLAHGSQHTRQGKPLFELHATVAFSSEAVMADRALIRRYERPTVPLQAGMMDLFAEDPGWMKPLLMQHGRGLVPRSTNERMTVYVYDVVSKTKPGQKIRTVDEFYRDMESLRIKLGAKRWCTRKYGWCVACVFTL